MTIKQGFQEPREKSLDGYADGLFSHRLDNFSYKLLRAQPVKVGLFKSAFAITIAEGKNNIFGFLVAMPSMNLNRTQLQLFAENCSQVGPAIERT